MSFAVVVPSKTTSNLVACIRAIHDHDPGHHTVIVDDGLNLNPWPEVLDGIDIIPGVKPFVFSRNINAGVKYAFEKWPETEGIVACNDDCLLQSTGGFSLLAQASREHPEFGCIGATTNVTGQPLQFRRNVGLREVDHIAYVCVYIPRSTFENVQWMDERYCIKYGCDDLDHCQAIKRAGLKVGVHDGCYVDHGSLVSSFRGNPKQPADFSQHYALYKQKWGIA